MNDKTLGQIAFEGYMATAGRYLSSFEEKRPSEKRLWEAGARAIVELEHERFDGDLGEVFFDARCEDTGMPLWFWRNQWAACGPTGQQCWRGAAEAVRKAIAHGIRAVA